MKLGGTTKVSPFRPIKVGEMDFFEFKLKIR